MDLFDGLDQIRWDEMEHAYGPAVEVPDILRGLVDPDPAVRETSLDAFHGGVHHQGDVYKCTVKAIPFLIRIARSAQAPGRPEVLELLRSLGGWDLSEDEPPKLKGRYRKANELIAADWPSWLGLLDDGEPAVREAAAGLLGVCVGSAGEVVEALRQHTVCEQVPAVRATIVRTVARLSRAARGDESEWLRERLDADPDPLVRLDVLAELATMPGAVPADVARVRALIAEGYAAPTGPVVPSQVHTDTLISAVRDLFEAGQQGRTRPDMDGLVRKVVASYGDDVTTRIALLVPALRSADWEERLDALYPASNLITGWRGRYDELVGLIGDQLSAQRQGLRARSTSILRDLGPLVAPAADALAGAVTASERSAPYSTMDRQSPWVVQWASGLPTLGPALAALAGIGDIRALPMLAWALDHEPLARDVGPAIAGLGPAAAGVLPLLRRRLAELPPDDERIGGLVRAAGAIGPAGVAALPEVLRVKPTQWTVAHIGGWGPAAADAIPALITWSADPALANAAALARWRIDGDADAAIAVLVPNLSSEPLVARSAAEALFDIGVPVGLNQLAAAMDEPNNPFWLAMAAARTLWRFTGDPSPLLPLLDDAWHGDLARPRVAAVWAELGPLAAEAAPKLAAELAEPRRLHARRDIHSNADVEVDEEFLAVVRRALAAIRQAS